jgi:tetratricopeptide (TPR) repeat protein
MKYDLEGNEEGVTEVLRLLFEMLEKAKKANVPQIELRARHSVIDIYWRKIRNYEFVFELCAEQERRIMEISVDDVPEKNKYAIQIADAYYFFKEYRKAISCYAKILEDRETIENQSPMSCPEIC